MLGGLDPVEEEAVAETTGELHPHTHAWDGRLGELLRDRVVEDSGQVGHRMVDEHAPHRGIGRQRHLAFGGGAGVDREGFVHGARPGIQFADTARSRASARSVTSQVKSGSSRPKWP